MKPETKVVTTTTTALKIRKEELLQVLSLAGYDIPKNAEVYVMVPGGGDYSNMHLDIDNHCPLFVSWTVRAES